MRQAEDGDPNDPFTRGLRQRFNDLQVERQLVLDQIAELDGPESAGPRPLSRSDVDVLDALPSLAVNLGRAPEGLQRRLYELTQLRVEVHYESQEATVVITLPREEMTMISNAATAVECAMERRLPRVMPTKPQVEASVNAVRAPGTA